MFDDEMPEKLYQWLVKQTPEKLISIMYTALDSMQGYNGQSIKEVIFESAGFERIDNGWKVPLNEDRRKESKEMWYMGHELPERRKVG